MDHLCDVSDKKVIACHLVLLLMTRQKKLHIWTANLYWLIDNRDVNKIDHEYSAH